MCARYPYIMRNAAVKNNLIATNPKCAILAPIAGEPLLLKSISYVTTYTDPRSIHRPNMASSEK